MDQNDEEKGSVSGPGLGVGGGEKMFGFGLL